MAQLDAKLASAFEPLSDSNSELRHFCRQTWHLCLCMQAQPSNYDKPHAGCVGTSISWDFPEAQNCLALGGPS